MQFVNTLLFSPFIKTQTHLKNKKHYYMSYVISL